MTWLADLPARIIGAVLALAFACGGWWMYAREARSRAAEHAAASAVVDTAREINRGRARSAADEYRAARGSQNARRANDAPRLRNALQRPIPCPPAASVPVADVLVPADAIRVLIDASQSAD